MAWWMWILLGFLLLALELVTPAGFYLFFFGIGAIAVGGFQILGLLGPAWMQWLAFSVFSLAAVLTLRKRLVRRFRGVGRQDDVDTLVGETALALEDIEVEAVGRAELRGSTWRVKNLGPTMLAVRQRCTVEAVEGLTLLVRSQ